MSDSILLAIDTATGPCSVAVLREGHVLATLQEPRTALPAARLLPMVEQLLTEAGIGYRDLARIVVTVGPGGFTGVRIGLASARAMGLAVGVPVVGVTTLAALAWQAQGNTVRIAILNAGKGELFAQRYNACMIPLMEPGIYTPQALTEQLESGDTLLGHIHLLPEPPPGVKLIAAMPHAIAAGSLVFSMPVLSLPAEPLYIRPPDALLPGGKEVPLHP